MPRFVLAPPDGEHLAVDWGQRFDGRRGDGTCIFSREKMPDFDVSVEDTGLYVYGNALLWTGEGAGLAKSPCGMSERGSILAMRNVGDRRAVVVNHFPDIPHGGGRWFVAVFQDRFANRAHTADALIANDNFAGRGVAAITEDLRVVVALDDRTLRILSPDGEISTASAPELAHRTTPYAVRSLSVAPPYIALVSDEGAGGTLHCLNGDLSERWSVALPFAAGEQPPIDDDRGRYVVTGQGIAAIEDGHVLWSAGSSEAVHATAFEDGTLAVAVGAELRIVDRDGSIRQVLRTSEGEPIPTPPAIARDGAVWVATQKALYVTR